MADAWQMVLRGVASRNWISILHATKSRDWLVNAKQLIRPPSHRGRKTANCSQKSPSLSLSLFTIPRKNIQIYLFMSCIMIWPLWLLKETVRVFLSPLHRRDYLNGAVYWNRMKLPVIIAIMATAAIGRFLLPVVSADAATSFLFDPTTWLYSRLCARTCSVCVLRVAKW